MELEEKKKERTVRTRELAEAVHENLDEMNAMRPKRKKLNKQVQQIIRLLKEKGVDVDPKKISITHNNEDEEDVYARLKVSLSNLSGDYLNNHVSCIFPITNCH